MFTTALFDCAINEKYCSVDGGRGICPLFLSPPRGIWKLNSPHLQEFAVQGKKDANAPGGGDQLRGKSKADTVPAEQTTFNSLRFGESGSVRTRSDRNNRILDIFQVFCYSGRTIKK